MADKRLDKLKRERGLKQLRELRDRLKSYHEKMARLKAAEVPNLYDIARLAESIEQTKKRVDELTSMWKPGKLFGVDGKDIL